jgi:hypothetical protein
VSGSHQRPGGFPISAAHEECSHGYCGIRCSPLNLVCCCLDRGSESLEGHYRWISHMPPSWSLERNKGDYTEKSNWPILSVMKQTLPITPSLHLTRTWGIVYCRLLMPLKALY